MNLFGNIIPPTVPNSVYLFISLIISVWTIVWQALALWRAAKYDQKTWFIAILLLGVYTFGIIAIVYLFYFSKDKMTFAELKGFVTKFNK